VEYEPVKEERYIRSRLRRKRYRFSSNLRLGISPHPKKIVLLSYEGTPKYTLTSRTSLFCDFGSRIASNSFTTSIIIGKYIFILPEVKEGDNLALISRHGDPVQNK